MKLKIILLSLAAITTLSACGENGKQLPSQTENDTGRWYSSQQIEQGKTVFSANCASCHGDKAQGLVADWKKTLADGSYPPPPLNGSAHAWHHPKAQLLRSINNGGAPVGGVMPAFSEKLSDEEKLAAIAYFQSFWTDTIYKQWSQRDGR